MVVLTPLSPQDLGSSCNEDWEADQTHHLQGWPNPTVSMEFCFSVLTSNGPEMLGPWRLAEDLKTEPVQGLPPPYLSDGSILSSPLLHRQPLNTWDLPQQPQLGKGDSSSLTGLLRPGNPSYFQYSPSYAPTPPPIPGLSPSSPAGLGASLGLGADMFP